MLNEGIMMVLAWYGMMTFIIGGVIYIGVKMVIDDIKERRS